MKNILLFLFMVSLFSCCTRNEPEHVKQGYRIIREFQRIAHEKYNLKPYMEGGGFMDQINRINLSFVHEGEKSIDELRYLLVDLTTDFLNIINSDEEVRPYLVEYPFQSERIGLIVVLIDQDGKRISNVGDKNDLLSRGALKDNILYYSILNDEKVIHQNKYIETYEKALNEVNKEKVK